MIPEETLFSGEPVLPVVTDRVYKSPIDRPWMQGDTMHYGDPIVIKSKDTEKNLTEWIQQDVFVRNQRGRVHYLFTRKYKEIHSKFLCVGGPLNGKVVPYTKDKDYTPYNCGVRGRDIPVRCIHIHKSILDPELQREIRNKPLRIPVSEAFVVNYNGLS